MIGRDFLTSAAAVCGAAIMLLPLTAATADHRPNHQNKKNPDLSIKVDRDRTLYGRAVTIDGKLRGADNASKTIELHVRPHPFTGRWLHIKTTTTDANGDYSFRTKPQLHSHYRTRAQVSPPQTSALVGVRVKKRINRRVEDRTPDRGDVITFTGRVWPAHDGDKVALQRRRSNGSWKTVGRATLEDAGPERPKQSVYERKKRVTRNSVFRVRIGRDEDHWGNKTRRIRIRIDA